MLGQHAISRSELDSYVRYVAGFDALAYPDSSQATCARRHNAPVCTQLRDQSLTRLLQERVVLDYATRHHITLSDRDTASIQTEMVRLESKSSPTRKLFYDGTVSRRFMRSILRRQLLVQKVQEHVAGRESARGPLVRIRRIRMPARSAALRRAALTVLRAVAAGAPVPATATDRTNWIAPFRLPHAMQQALAHARTEMYLGPFEHAGQAILVRLEARTVGPYNALSRAEARSYFFNQWLQSALRKARPRCAGAGGRLTVCPPRIVNAA